MSETTSTIAMPGYLPRVADGEVESALRRRGAVLIEGVRGCGKTWAARSLLRLKNKVAPPRRGELAAMLVVTSTGAAYRRPDGVQVAPITMLAP